MNLQNYQHKCIFHCDDSGVKMLTSDEGAINTSKSEQAKT